MYGVVTRNAEELEWSAFDVGFYEVKDVTGRAAAPLSTGVNMVSAFGDNAAVGDDPSLAAVDAEGRPATRERPYFDWSYVCPTHERYREGLLEIVDDCVAERAALRLDDVGFPRDGYCRCERCDRRFAESEFADREDWRASVVTDFVRDVRDRVPGDLYLTVYPDPYPGHLRTRSGVDIEALAPMVEEFVVPIYDTEYGTTYWLETIAKGFESRLADADVRLGIELYAVEVDIDALVHATEVAAAYADGVYFGYDASNAAATIRRLQADRQEGASHGADGGD
ncbi:hypothetical protein DU500_12910 [Haloplanus rubicundus]|uniref:Glycoside hydrolase domain protein n=1 Tax=Haloplanus rubicundus TaxID=1547898 RepID=A0A345EEM7_9EURY|nr:hypothetical protein [Haloplanus rubicundus]AXG07249.1 hypothetical protein DU500_12910 [Haloplanus rubicundus]AXG10649.1 hypothetical protein DU484_12795 [Haloplanus rubicundus]